jgi:hypothetical protein
MLLSGFIPMAIQFLPVDKRTEAVLDSNNNNVKISLQAPDDWNSRKVSKVCLGWIGS